jgi:hypothetical protein
MSQPAGAISRSSAPPARYDPLRNMSAPSIRLTSSHFLFLLASTLLMLDIQREYFKAKTAETTIWPTYCMGFNEFPALTKPVFSSDFV